jgi:hypothetical protein
MATTTNYGWTTPDDTALVKDGASAIRTLGTSVDTTTKNLNPETTLGDIAYRSSTSNVNTRLGIGTTGQLLTVAGGVPTWAAAPASGSLTLLSTTSLTGTSVTISSISQSYKNLLVVVNGVYLASDDRAITVTFNAAASAHNFARFGLAGGSFNSGSDINAGYAEIGRAGNNSSALYAMTSILQIVRYTETGTKTFSSNYYFRPGSGSNGGGGSNGTFTASSGITSIKFEAETISFSGGTVYIYGVL